MIPKAQEERRGGDMVRFKKRYLVVEVATDPPAHVRMSALHSAVVSAVKRMHGDFGVAAITSGLGVKYSNPDTHVAVISVGRGPHNLVATALPFITEVGGQPVVVRSLHKAASIRHAFIFLKNYNEEKIRQLEEDLPAGEKERWKQVKLKTL